MEQKHVTLAGSAAVLAFAAGNMAKAVETLVENIRATKRPTGGKSFGRVDSHPKRMMKKELPNGKFTMIPEPPVPEYVGARMYYKTPSRRDRQRSVNFGSSKLPPADANRILAAEAKRNRKADRNLTLAHRGAFN